VTLRTILVADGVPIFRTGVRNLLVRESDFQVIEADSLNAIQRLAPEDSPDIALVDSDLPPSGVAAAEWLVRNGSTQVVVWSLAPTRDSVLAAIRAGARGYLHKEISPQGLVRALRGLILGEAPLARDLAALMIDGLHGMEQRATARERASSLSAREREVLMLIAAGARNKQIAVQLLISEFTVKRHVQNILQKLGLPSRHAAAGFYRAAYEEDGMPEAVTQLA
jgi:two-component system nitrate/nitrite response regulator NarL